MSKSGSRYLREERARKKSRWKRSPFIRYIKSLDFIGKFCLGVLLVTVLIFDVVKNGDHPLLIVLAVVTLVFFPFAKRGSDDAIRHFTSEKTFEFINSSYGLGALYPLVLLLLSIPLGTAYCLYLLFKHKETK